MTAITLNVGNFVTLCLNNSNCPLWQEQILVLVESQNLVEHMQSEKFSPPEFESTLDAPSGFGKLEPPSPMSSGAN